MTLSANDEWTEAPLEKVTRPDAPIGYGIVQPGPNVPGGIPVIAIRDLPKPAMQAVHRSSPHIESQYRRSRVTPGDILISVKGTTGRVGLVPNGFKGNISRDVARVRLREGQEPRYWFQLLRSPEVQTTLQLAAVGTTRQELSIGTLKKLSFRFPDRNEQERVADILADADELIASIEHAVAKKQAIKQGMMQQLMTGATRLPGFVGEWRQAPLAEVSTMKGRIGWQGLTQDEFTSDARQPFLITGMNFKDGAIEWKAVYHVSDERYAVAPEIQLCAGDVLMTKDGTIGKLLYVDSIPSPGKATLNSHLLVFRSQGDSYIPRFLYYQLASMRFSKHIELYKSGTTFFGISQESVGKYQMLLPSPKEQVEIAAALSDMDSEIAMLQTRLSKARDIKIGMMQQLLTGRTRLSV